MYIMKHKGISPTVSLDGLVSHALDPSDHDMMHSSIANQSCHHILSNSVNIKLWGLFFVSLNTCPSLVGILCAIVLV